MRSTSLSSCGGAVAAVGAAGADALDDHRLGDGGLDRHPRVERAVGVLKDDLHFAAHGAELAAGELGEVDAVVETWPPVGSMRRRMARPVVVLPQPRFADEAERLAADRR